MTDELEVTQENAQEWANRIVPRHLERISEGEKLRFTKMWISEKTRADQAEKFLAGVLNLLRELTTYRVEGDPFVVIPLDLMDRIRDILCRE